ncbi:hypothetical protein CFP56_021345 [Quercus suber]|uniref:Uncharacterized protein n=1 Tax=Quercus suber TaxID=58331 RepID=A0AAW0KEA3_QUESU
MREEEAATAEEESRNRRRSLQQQWDYGLLGWLEVGRKEKKEEPLLPARDLDRRGGEAGGAAAMGVVAGGQRSGDRHRDQCLVSLVVLTWWPVSQFGGRRLFPAFGSDLSGICVVFGLALGGWI